MCKCKSYNRKVKGAKHPNVILEVPKRLRTKRVDGTEQRTIVVDKCMAKRLVSLWAAGLQTMNCCCGHNKFMPTIIIPDDACLEDYFKILDRYGQTCIAQWRKFKGEFSLFYYVKIGLAIFNVSMPPKIYDKDFYRATRCKLEKALDDSNVQTSR